jgi:hypothetical protein
MDFSQRFTIQCNLYLVTLNLVTVLQRLFFNLLHKIIKFSDIMRFSDSFCGDVSVTKSRLHCITQKTKKYFKSHFNLKKIFFFNSTYMFYKSSLEICSS